MTRLPQDALAAIGAFDNLLVVVPPWQFVIVRTSTATRNSGKASFQKGLWQILASASG
ncbi:MAG: hypothetical protein HOI67_00780 [Gammaproteobacteria bacterium]|nr:hypothetical protein [Gammaproteobacteria bacterium]